MDNILVLAPHTDDGEIGCGATIEKNNSIDFSEKLTNAFHYSCRTNGRERIIALGIEKKYF